MEENENGQTGVIRPLLKDIYTQLSTCTYEDWEEYQAKGAK